LQPEERTLQLRATLDDTRSVFEQIMYQFDLSLSGTIAGGGNSH
jgi:hypothetical protein